MKKYFFVAVIGLAFGLALAAQPGHAAYTPVAGGLIKTATDSAVYYIAADGQRHLYSNEATFWTWYGGTWSSIKDNGATKTIQVVSQDDFNNIPVGNNVTVKPGVGLVKFDNSPNIYMAIGYGRLAPIASPSGAQTFFDEEWSSKVITIQKGFETDYEKNEGFLDLAYLSADEVAGRNYLNTCGINSMTVPVVFGEIKSSTSNGTADYSCAGANGNLFINVYLKNNKYIQETSAAFDEYLKNRSYSDIKKLAVSFLSSSQIANVEFQGEMENSNGQPSGVAYTAEIETSRDTPGMGVFQIVKRQNDGSLVYLTYRLLASDKKSWVEYFNQVWNLGADNIADRYNNVDAAFKTEMDAVFVSTYNSGAKYFFNILADSIE